jgi:hypothetical protein
MAHDGWLEIPVLFREAQYAQLCAVFDAHGVLWWSDAVNTKVKPWGASHAQVLYVHPDHAGAAATILRLAFDLEDATRDEPFSGPCPACGAEAVKAWACPDCELSFRSRHAPDDPLIEWVRAHGGFERV